MSLFLVKTARVHSKCLIQGMWMHKGVMMGNFMIYWTCSLTFTYHFTTNTTEGTKKSFINDHLACASAVEMKHFTVFVAAEYTCPWFISMLNSSREKNDMLSTWIFIEGEGGGKEGKKGEKKTTKII